MITLDICICLDNWENNAVKKLKQVPPPQTLSHTFVYGIPAIVCRKRGCSSYMHCSQYLALQTRQSSSQLHPLLSNGKFLPSLDVDLQFLRGGIF